MDSKKKKSSFNKVKKVENILLDAYENFLNLKKTYNAKIQENTKNTTSKNKTKQPNIKDNINKESAEFDSRLNLKYKDLKNLYLKLYKDSGLFDDLINKLRDIYINRPNALKMLDKKREKNEDWYLSNKIIGESLYIDKFAKDIKSTIEKLSYFEKLGVNYLNCKLDSTKDSSLINFSSISKRTIGDLKKLAMACVDKNIVLGLNISINSTKKTYDWAKKAVEGNASYQDMYYCLNFRDAKKLDNSLVSKTSSDMFVYSKKINKYFMTSSNKLQLDLNYNNPLVFNEMIYNMLSLANKGIQAFNLNSLENLFHSFDTLAENKTHTLLRMFRLIISIVSPGVLLINDSQEDQEHAKAYFGTKLKPECHLVNNNSICSNVWNALASSDVNLLRKNISFLNKLKDHQSFINCVNDENISLKFNKSDFDELNIDYDKHIKFLQDFYSGKSKNSFASGQIIGNKLFGTTASLCGIEKYKGKNLSKLELSMKRVALLYSFIMSLAGVPFINCGDEIATLNDYSFEKDEKIKSDTSNLQKAEFNWKDAKNIDNARTTQGRVFKEIKRISTVRRSNKCFGATANIKLKSSGDDSVICFSRQVDDIIILCIFNFSSSEKFVKLMDTFAKNLQNRKEENLSLFKLGAYEYKFLKINK